MEAEMLTIKGLALGTAVAALTSLGALPARADVVWMMNWMAPSPQAGCQPTDVDAIDAGEEFLKRQVPGTKVRDEGFKVGKVFVVRQWAEYPNGNRNHFVYVDDYGFCLATFYIFRNDELLYRSGKPTLINTPD
jgi:hypothetical protein